MATPSAVSGGMAAKALLTGAKMVMLLALLRVLTNSGVIVRISSNELRSGWLERRSTRGL